MALFRNFSLLIAGFLLLAGCEPTAAEFYPLSIETKKGIHTFQVELADTNAERERGLMMREKLDSDKGMIFIFDGEAPRAFWMKDTLVPLDMLFIKADGTIANIHKNARPHDETAISSEMPVKAVLEIHGGEADKRGIRIGDHVATDLLKKEITE